MSLDREKSETDLSEKIEREREKVGLSRENLNVPVSHHEREPIHPQYEIR